MVIVAAAIWSHGQPRQRITPTSNSNTARRSVSVRRTVSNSSSSSNRVRPVASPRPRRPSHRRPISAEASSWAGAAPRRQPRRRTAKYRRLRGRTTPSRKVRKNVMNRQLPISILLLLIIIDNDCMLYATVSLGYPLCSCGNWTVNFYFRQGRWLVFLT